MATTTTMMSGCRYSLMSIMDYISDTPLPGMPNKFFIIDGVPYFWHARTGMIHPYMADKMQDEGILSEDSEEWIAGAINLGAAEMEVQGSSLAPGESWAYDMLTGDPIAVPEWIENYFGGKVAFLDTNQLNEEVKRVMWEWGEDPSNEYIPEEYIEGSYVSSTPIPGFKKLAIAGSEAFFWVPQGGEDGYPHHIHVFQALQNFGYVEEDFFSGHQGVFGYTDVYPLLPRQITSADVRNVAHLLYNVNDKVVIFGGRGQNDVALYPEDLDSVEQAAQEADNPVEESGWRNWFGKGGDVKRSLEMRIHNIIRKGYNIDLRGMVRMDDRPILNALENKFIISPELSIFWEPVDVDGVPTTDGFPFHGDVTKAFQQKGVSEDGLMTGYIGADYRGLNDGEAFISTYGDITPEHLEFVYSLFSECPTVYLDNELIKEGGEELYNMDKTADWWDDAIDGKGREITVPTLETSHPTGYSKGKFLIYTDGTLLFWEGMTTHHGQALIQAEHGGEKFNEHSREMHDYNVNSGVETREVWAKEGGVFGTTGTYYTTAYGYQFPNEEQKKVLVDLVSITNVEEVNVEFGSGFETFETKQEFFDYLNNGPPPEIGEIQVGDTVVFANGEYIDQGQVMKIEEIEHTGVGSIPVYRVLPEGSEDETEFYADQLQKVGQTDTVELYRGLHFGLVSEEEAVQALEDPLAFTQTHTQYYSAAGIHWTDDISSAENFALGRDPDGWPTDFIEEDEEERFDVGLVFEAEVSSGHILTEEDEEYEMYQMGEGILDYNIEREITVRDGSPVNIKRVYVLYTDTTTGMTYDKAMDYSFQTTASKEAYYSWMDEGEPDVELMEWGYDQEEDETDLSDFFFSDKLIPDYPLNKFVFDPGKDKVMVWGAKEITDYPMHGQITTKVLPGTEYFGYYHQDGQLEIYDDNGTLPEEEVLKRLKETFPQADSAFFDGEVYQLGVGKSAAGTMDPDISFSSTPIPNVSNRFVWYDYNLIFWEANKSHHTDVFQMLSEQGNISDDSDFCTGFYSDSNFVIPMTVGDIEPMMYDLKSKIPEADTVVFELGDEPLDLNNLDEEFKYGAIKEAENAEVENKARKIYDQGGVSLVSVTPDEDSGRTTWEFNVKSTSGNTYPLYGDSDINRPGEFIEWSDVACSCEWGRWNYDRDPEYAHLESLMCSHALAAQHWLADNGEKEQEQKLQESQDRQREKDVDDRFEYYPEGLMPPGREGPEPAEQQDTQQDMMDTQQAPESPYSRPSRPMRGDEGVDNQEAPEDPQEPTEDPMQAPEEMPEDEQFFPEEEFGMSEEEEDMQMEESPLRRRAKQAELTTQDGTPITDTPPLDPGYSVGIIWFPNGEKYYWDYHDGSAMHGDAFKAIQGGEGEFANNYDRDLYRHENKGDALYGNYWTGPREVDINATEPLEDWVVENSFVNFPDAEMLRYYDGSSLEKIPLRLRPHEYDSPMNRNNYSPDEPLYFQMNKTSEYWDKGTQIASETEYLDEPPSAYHYKFLMVDDTPIFWNLDEYGYPHHQHARNYLTDEGVINPQSHLLTGEVGGREDDNIMVGDVSPSDEQVEVISEFFPHWGTINFNYVEDVPLTKASAADPLVTEEVLDPLNEYGIEWNGEELKTAAYGEELEISNTPIPGETNRFSLIGDKIFFWPMPDGFHARGNAEILQRGLADDTEELSSYGYFNETTGFSYFCSSDDEQHVKDLHTMKQSVPSAHTAKNMNNYNDQFFVDLNDIEGSLGDHFNLNQTIYDGEREGWIMEEGEDQYKIEWEWAVDHPDYDYDTEVVWEDKDYIKELIKSSGAILAEDNVLTFEPEDVDINYNFLMSPEGEFYQFADLDSSGNKNHHGHVLIALEYEGQQFDELPSEVQKDWDKFGRQYAIDALYRGWMEGTVSEGRRNPEVTVFFGTVGQPITSSQKQSLLDIIHATPRLQGENAQFWLDDGVNNIQAVSIDEMMRHLEDHS